MIFKEKFNKDDKGVRRDWEELSVKAIKEYYDATVQIFNPVLEQFAQISVPTGITKAQGGPSHDVTDECDLKIKSTGILKEEEINTVIKKFKEDTLHAYDEAIQAHKNKTRE